MKRTKRILAMLVVLIFALSATLSVSAASTKTITFEITPTEAFHCEQRYLTGGSTVKFTFKAANNPNCHYYCTITSGAIYGDSIVTTGQVLGNGTDSSTVTTRNLSSGYYFITVRPINGTIINKDVLCTLTVSYN